MSNVFGELNEEKRQNFEKNKNYKNAKYGEYMLFTNNENKRYKVFPNDHIDFRYKIDDKNEMLLGKGVFGEVLNVLAGI